MDKFIKVNLAVLVLGLCFLLFYIYQFYEVSQVKHWSRIDAEVTESRTTEYEYMTQGKYTGTSFHKHQDLIFAFTYEISGHQYLSRYFYWIGKSPLDVVSEYPVGFHFRAYYNPNNPSEAAVDSGFASNFFWVISIILFLVGLIGLKQSAT